MPPTRLVLLGLFLLTAACAGTGSDAPSTSAEPGDQTLYHGARLIIGDGTVLENGSLLVEGGAITAVAPTGALTVPAGVHTVDLTGRTVIPALIDGHGHLGFEGFTGWGGEHYSRENVVQHLERYAYYGFGAVFSAGTDPERMMLELQRGQREGRVGGARVLFAAGMAPPGQGPNAQLLETARVLEEPILRGVASAEEARAQVREVAALGIPFIKIWVDDRNGAQEKLPPEVYAPLIEEARRHGIRVFAHQQTIEDMHALIDAGVHGFLHGRLGPAFDDAIVARLRGSGAFVIPNIGLGERGRTAVHEDPFLAEAVAPEVVARLREEYTPRSAAAPAQEQALAAAFRRMIDGGVEVILGTDAGAVPDHFFGYSGHQELAIYTRLGMTPMEALVAATGRAAEHLGLTDMGTLAAGKRADFVVLNADPLEDIANTRAIAAVYLGGVQVDREAQRRGFGGQ